MQSPSFNKDRPLPEPSNRIDLFSAKSKGGGEFFGKVGSFEPGYEFDAIVMDDAALPTTRACSLPERLERMVYLSDGAPCAKYVQGRRLF